MQRYPLSDTVDAVIIGTGAGGSPVLARLAQAGLKVVAIEAGSFLNPDEYASDEVAQKYLYWLDERLTTGANPVAFGSNNSGTGVGGSTLHWGAYAPRPNSRDMRIKEDFGIGVDWPLAYDDLLPYFEEVERFIGVSGPEHYPWEPGRKYPLPALPLNAPAQLMQRGCDALGIRHSPAPIAALSAAYSGPHADYPERHACVNRGYCHQGCRNGAKASMDVTYLPAAVRAGAEIRAEAFVTDLERDEQGLLTAVVYQQDGQELRQRTKAVFLCAGAIESARLLLRLGLANSSGQVGRNFMAHPSTQIWGTFKEDTRPYKGFPASLITEDPIRPKDADFAGGYLIQSYGIMPVAWAGSVSRGRGLWGADLVRYLQSFPNIAGMGISGECLPSEQNFVELSDELDSRGLPKPLVHFTAGENENRLMDHATKLMHQIWEAAGGTDRWTLNRMAHQIGTCRMGEDPGNSVVDPWGRSHDIPNLYISDNSTFPTAMPANPALTIMAIALRTADHFLGRLS
ncbi:GMC family oxidoreductase [Acidipila sp. EB88]|nr:GMC family oxidoreductase [Acidipila sp. EB88]